MQTNENLTSPACSTGFDVPSVPSRFKESNFRRFEGILTTVAQTNGQPLFVKPHDISCETFSCRLRDAMTALQRNVHWSPDLAKALTAIWPRVTVSHDGTTIRIGPRIQRLAKGGGEVVETEKPLSSRPTQEIVLDNLRPEVIESAFDLLCHLNGEVQVRFQNGTTISPSFLTDLILRCPNVEIVTSGPDIILL